MDRLLLDLRTAWRGLVRTPSFALTAILILSLGIGMATAMTSVFEAVLLRRLPVVDQDRIVVLWTYREPGIEFGGLRGDLESLARESRLTKDIAGIGHWGAATAPLLDGDRPLALNRALVTGSFFRVLGTQPVLGRLLVPDDDLLGAGNVLVLSHATWQKTFGGDSSIIGRVLTEPYSRSTFTIVGVAPPGLDYPSGTEYWIPAWRDDNLSITMIARLTPGATPSLARDEFLSIMQRLPPVERALRGASVQTFTDAVVGDVRPVLVVLSIAVALLLLIAAVNVGNLLLLRSTSRARELAIRRTLGASHRDLFRQLLVESGLLAIGGGALGLFLARLLVQLLVAFGPRQLPRLDVIGLTGTPLTIVVSMTVLSVLVFGVFPALMTIRVMPAASLRADARSGTTSRSRRYVRQLLVCTQVALALIMLAGAGLLVRTLERFQRIEYGYDPEQLSILQFSFDATKFDSLHKWLPLGEQLMPQLHAIPGVVAATPVLLPPFLGANVFHGRLDLEGQSPSEVESNPMIPLEVGGSEYFRTMGITIVRGRGFLDSDREDSEPVAVVSEAVARRSWPGADPIGKRIRYWGPDTLTWRTVVGVARDIRYRSLLDATPTIYLPYRQAYWQAVFAVRTQGGIERLIEPMRLVARDVDPQLNLWSVQPMRTLLAGPTATPRLSAFVLSLFAISALLLAAIGLYGVMASAVREQTHEIGVRMALGATTGRIRRTVLGRALLMIVAGTIVGLAGALAGARVLRSLLFEVSPSDPLTLFLVCLLLTAVGFIAAYLPARRATKIDPSRALRMD